jgi:predicted small integral membrane protein
MTAPGFYALRFILFGRGHDATEFQEAQAALGLPYDGHALDWAFAGLFLGATAFWLWRTRRPLSLRLAARLVIGSVVALTALILLQSVNNLVFDPLFAARR